MKTEQFPVSGLSEADAYDQMLDDLVDKRAISYDDARRELGQPPYEMYELPPTPAGRQLGKAATGHTVSRYESARDRNRRWANAIRAMLAQKRNDQ